MVKIVEAKSVEDYLERYYKKSRMTPTMVKSYQEEFGQFGYICTSHHDNVTGEFIAWPFYPNQKGGHHDYTEIPLRLGRG